MTKMPERTTTYKEAYDCKRVRPCALGNEKCTGDPDKSHGIGSARYIFTVSGENRAVEMTVMTGHYRAETLISFSSESRRLLARDEMAELIFHYPSKEYAWGGEPNNTECVHTGGDCWVDSGSLWGQAVWDDTMRQAEGAEEFLFAELEKIWSEMDKKEES
jgi:hypothetical protein